MIKRMLAATALAACATTPAQAAGLELAVGNDIASLRYLTDSASMGYGGADLGFGGFFNNNDDIMLTGNILVTGSPGRDVPLQYGVGAKAFVTNLDADRDAHAIGVGGQLRYMLPFATPMGVSVEGYYAPSIVSFGDADSLIEVTPRFEIEIVPGTRAFVGYRLTEFDLENGGDAELADEINVGIRLSF